MGTVVVGTLLAPIVIPAIGFTSAGVAAGSIAAAIQGPTVAAGSAFAVAQSAGALGAGACALVGAKVGAVVGATGAAGAFGAAAAAAAKSFGKANTTTGEDWNQPKVGSVRATDIQNG